MNLFPTHFSPEITWLDSSTLTDNGELSLASLQAKGYDIQLGITEKDVAELTALSFQHSIREYCPNDCTERFKDRATTETWFKKGRVAFLLKERSSGAIAGYGWSGPGKNEHIPRGTLTGALRLSELYRGQGLATPFLAVMLDYTTNNWPEDVLWFEAWESNAGAVHIYEKFGFETVDERPDTRPTADGGIANDVRLFMQLK